MSLPLDGIKVLDLTNLLPGPFCSMILGDFGAEVIKIERAGQGDNSRRTKPLILDTGTYYLLLNRNKKSLTLDLKAEKGKEVFLKLLKTADVVLDGFRPGVLKRLGCDYEAAKIINPGIIYCALTGYGQDGPYVNYPGHDVNYLSYAGVIGMTGRKGAVPTIPGVQISDIGGGSQPAVIGILLALMERNKTGKGQFVDISLLDGAVSWLTTLASPAFAGEEKIARGETRLTGKYACYEVYETKNSEYISLGSNESHFWRNLCQYFNREDFIPHQYNDDKQEEMMEFFRVQFKQQTREHWVERLLACDVCIAPVYNVNEVFKDPQVLYRKMVFEMDHPRLGTIKQLGFPIKLSETPAQVRQHPPDFGEHNDEILAELGYTAEEINELKTQGVL